MSLQPNARELWEKLLSLESEEELREWIRIQGDDEGLHLEFKAQIDSGGDAKENLALKSICAFANSEGGILLIGVRNKPIWPENSVALQDLRGLTPESVRQQIRDSFVSVRPEYEIQWAGRLPVIAILVRGNSREPILIRQYKHYIGGFRRKGDKSESLTQSEIFSYLAGWKSQFDTIMTRYNELVQRNFALSLNSSNDAISSVLVSALPVTFIPKATLHPIRHEELVVPALPAYFKISEVRNQSAIMTIVGQAWKEGQSGHTLNFSIAISSFGNGTYSLSTFHFGYSHDKTVYQRLLVIGLYSVFAYSNFIDDVRVWAVQGFTSVDRVNRSISREPILFQSPADVYSSTHFPAIVGTNDIDKETVMILESICAFIGSDIQSVFGSGADSSTSDAATQAFRILSSLEFIELY